MGLVHYKNGIQHSYFPPGGEFSLNSGLGLSEKKGYQGQEENFAPARFHYLYFILRRRLAQQNTGDLGGLWHRLPADTRLPDHSIWQHNGLVSALTSSFRLSKQNKASLMVFALTPVQDFIVRARKLRDYWSGSILLSWLAFEGIKAVIHELGADHILYPSLHGQPLIDNLLEDWQMDKKWLGENVDKAGVASFPNKLSSCQQGRWDLFWSAAEVVPDQFHCLELIGNYHFVDLQSWFRMNFHIKKEFHKNIPHRDAYRNLLK